MQLTMPNGVPGALDRWAHRFARGSSAIAALLLLGMWALISVEVVLRYLLHSSTLVADEYAGYMFAALVFLGLNQAIHQEKLIGIDVSGRWAKVVSHPLVRFLRNLLMLGLNLALLYAMTLTLMTSMRFHSRSIHFSKTVLAYPQSLVVLGLALACFASLALLVRARSRH